MQVLVLLLVCLVVLTLLFLVAEQLYVIVRCMWLRAAPFVPVNARSIPHIVAEIALTQDDLVYDLGCGDGRILRALHTKEPRARYVGVEWDWLPYVLAKFRTRNIARQSLTLKRKNFYTENLTGATCLVLYLFPQVLNQLLPKFRAELAPGTRIFSVDFQFADLTPTRTVDLPPIVGSINKRLYEYRL